MLLLTPYKYKSVEIKFKSIHLTEYIFLPNHLNLQNTSNVDRHPNPHILLGRPPVVPMMGRFGAGCNSSTLVVTSTHWDPCRQMFWRAHKTVHGALDTHPSVHKVSTFQPNLIKFFCLKMFNLYFVEVVFSLH